MEYEATIGLEIHAELNTKTKMFCSSKNDASETRPNVNVCPVCLAHPGTLPVINQEAVRHVLRVGAALGSTLADYTEFDRKNYFYPDLPKGYQISQFEYPLVSGGMLAGVPITRIHLEEDTASSTHDDSTGSTLIDYNRGGVPLMELVTEPAMHTPEEAGNFARELQLLLRYLGASEANMEKGQMRVEANVSVARKGEMSKTYVEIKNLNSFRTMERAVAYEIDRQIKLMKEGGVLQKQTLGWDENKACTFPQRSKEGSADYRYFPDPDLPSLKISEIRGLDAKTLSQSLPELPAARRSRYMGWGLKPDDAELYVRDTRFGNFIDQIQDMLGTGSVLVTSSNYLANDIANIIRETEERDTENKQNIAIKTEYFVGMMQKVEEKKLSSRAAKDLLKEVWFSGADPVKLAEERGLLGGVDMAALKKVVEGVLAVNPSVVQDYKNGKIAAIEFLFGQCMKQLRGAGDPAQIREVLKGALDVA
jgi:aspartyl-tRNA(Asn)/glutamyl-tRNA(Gln) amidotransferase subunit B